MEFKKPERPSVTVPTFSVKDPINFYDILSYGHHASKSIKENAVAPVSESKTEYINNKVALRFSNNKEWVNNSFHAFIN